MSQENTEQESDESSSSYVDQGKHRSKQSRFITSKNQKEKRNKVSTKMRQQYILKFNKSQMMIRNLEKIQHEKLHAQQHNAIVNNLTNQQQTQKQQDITIYNQKVQNQQFIQNQIYQLNESNNYYESLKLKQQQIKQNSLQRKQELIQFELKFNGDMKKLEEECQKIDDEIQSICSNFDNQIQTPLGKETCLSTNSQQAQQYQRQLQNQQYPVQQQFQQNQQYQQTVPQQEQQQLYYQWQQQYQCPIQQQQQYQIHKKQEAIQQISSSKTEITEKNNTLPKETYPKPSYN